ncbi:hypothetical protein [Kocuria salsicia]|uniref:hypothetical protein n=1 Tax=Kocuria salsicia TaxID=664639 RepID=UPI001643D0EF|nr:hypothetical protein [Kocuria salsicia]
MQGTRVARGPGGTDGDDGVTRVGGDSAVVRVGDNDDAALGSRRGVVTASAASQQW